MRRFERLLNEVLSGYHIGERRPRSAGGGFKSDPVGPLKSDPTRLYGIPKFYEILSNKLSRLTNHNIIILVGDDMRKYATGCGKSPNLDTLSNITGISPEAFSEAVTVCITTDLEQSGVSPWKILHQLAEAIASYSRDDVWYDHILPKYGNILKDAVLYRTPSIDTDRYPHALNAHWDEQVFHYLFKMRSAREFIKGEFGNYDMGPELLVEYLWHGGKIRINYPTWLDKNLVDSIKSDIEDWCRNTMIAHKGCILDNTGIGAD